MNPQDGNTVYKISPRTAGLTNLLFFNPIGHFSEKFHMSKQLSLAIAALASAAAALATAVGGESGDAAEVAGKPAGKAGAAGKAGKAGAAKPTHTRAELTAVMNELKESKGASVAKGLIKEVGGSDKLAEVADAKIDELVKAAKEALAEGDDGDDGDDGL